MMTRDSGLLFWGHPVYDVHTENRRHISGPGPLRPPAVTSVKLVLTFRLIFLNIHY